MGSIFNNNTLHLPQCAHDGIGAGIQDTLIGFGLVVVASCGICAALNIQKLVHMRNQDPITGEPRVNFARLPLWWVGMVLNTASELINLAALGFAPATLVTPLGCITVGLNSVTSVVWLGEPFVKRDMLGIVLLTAGVACVVMSQVGAPVQPITTDYLCCGPASVFRSPVFFAYVSIVVGGLVVLRLCLEKRFARRYSWVYLGESALFGSVSTVAARAFASMVVPGVGHPAVLWGPECWVAWGSLVVLGGCAVFSLVLQNRAMMHFGNSEVVPIYFCLFTIGGVMGAAMAYRELCWPWVLLFLPGLALCMLGVSSIAYRRNSRLAAHESSGALAEPLADADECQAEDAATLAAAGRETWRDSTASHASVSIDDSLLTLGGASLSSTTLLMVSSSRAPPGSDSLLNSPISPVIR